MRAHAFAWALALVSSIALQGCMLEFWKSPSTVAGGGDRDNNPPKSGTEYEMLGNWDLTTPWPGAGVIQSVSNSPVQSQICINNQILGIAGNAVCQEAPTAMLNAIPANVLINNQFWDGNGQRQAGTMPNNGDWHIDTNSSLPGEGYYHSFIGLPSKARVCSGTPYLGDSVGAACIDNSNMSSTGLESKVLRLTRVYDSNGKYIDGSMENFSAETKVPFDSRGYLKAGFYPQERFPGKPFGYLFSNIFRSGGVPQKSYQEMQNSINDLTSYHEIPQVALDDELTIGGARTGIVAIDPLAPFKMTNTTCVGGISPPCAVCGDSGTVEQRIADCNTMWSAQSAAKQGESTWKLVTKMKIDAVDYREVWRDERTQLLWSDRVGGDLANATPTNNVNQFDWCVAAGNTENAAGIDCTKGAANATAYNTPGVGLCAASTDADIPSSSMSGVSGGTAFINTPPWTGADNTIVLAKGKLDSTTIGGSVRWRLPTLADWKQADVDGLRMVLPNISPTSGFWSATVVSYDPDNTGSALARQYAFTYNNARNTGDIGAISRGSAAAVRCIGRTVLGALPGGNTPISSTTILDP